MNNLSITLNKPLVFIKVHTTGLNPALDRIIQITISRYNTDGTKKTGTRLVNPEMPIPAIATKYNGITDAMVAGKPTFFALAQKLHEFIGDCDIAGFNAEFDLKFLMEEFARAGLNFTCTDRNIIDLQEMYHQLQPRDFIQAAKEFAGVDYLRGAPINSESWTDSCVSILNGMVTKHLGNPVFDRDGNQKSFEANVTSISQTFGKGGNFIDMKGQLVKGADGAILINFGKYNTRPLEEVIRTDMGYIQWLLSSDKTPRDTKNIVEMVIKKMNTVSQSQ